ncbi:hypothetical protein IFR04_006634 [Cadophora malorum]|uniref:BTB domain-containing protein n=1 Tax=Cadophora malorum TaxID=108018 RepID=A0A8H7TIW1_9HELO|nr:hypothetical protein IFR04_006634 [Cadophora malorum]
MPPPGLQQQTQPSSMATLNHTAEPQSFAEYLGKDIVTFEVGTGPTRTKFTIHKKALCRKAPHFDEVFNGGSLEARTQISVLDEDDPKAFALFVSWIYNNPVEVPSTTSNDDCMHTFLHLLECAENIKSPH